MHRRLLLALLLAGGAAACAVDDAAPAERPRRSVAVDGGDERVLGLLAVSVRAAPGDDVVVRNANTARGETAGAGHALVASAGGLPPLFRPVAGGAVPNGAVWGRCSGGTAAPGQLDCPVPPVEGPERWDGRQYWSLGDLLPGEERVLPLADLLPPGDYDLWCGKHPDLRVRVVVEDSADEGPEAVVPRPAPAPVPAPASGEVLVAPDGADGGTEVLAFVPSTVAVPVGGTVTWRVDGPAPHSVELGGGRVTLLDSAPETALAAVPAGARWDGTATVRSGWMGTDGSAPGGEAFAVTFTAPGRYRYVCRFHPSMTGEVVVV